MSRKEFVSAIAKAAQEANLNLLCRESLKQHWEKTWCSIMGVDMYTPETKKSISLVDLRSP